ncbi:MAG: hypothetical protein H5T97_07650, partial [Firmicutes bacterium]|nr:hypothetical protein [Bacillota bacterium]
MALVVLAACLALAGCGGALPGSPAGDQKPAGQATGQPAQGQPTAGQAPAGQEAGAQAPAGGRESLEGLVGKGAGVLEKGVTYEYVLTAPEGSMSFKVWMQGSKHKTEGTMAGQKVVSIFNGQDKTLITYYPDRNEAVRLTAEGPAVKTRSPGDYAGAIDFGRARVIETVSYEGARCRVVLLSEPGGSETELWIREDCGIPVRVEVTEPDGDKTVVEYRNIQFGPLPPGTFELPEGVKVTDVGQMLEQLQKS